MNLYFLSIDIIYYLLLLGLLDILLINLIGKKSRWYQLHVCGNSLVTINIFNDVLELYIDPINSYKILKNHNSSIIVLSMHIYHCIFFKLNYMDYIHHTIFVMCGVAPVIFLIKTNQVYFGYIACSGIPGIFEYTILTLSKNNYITNLEQKKINSLIYNFIRYPMCIYGAASNILFRNYNQIILNDNLVLSIYINLLLFLNGSVFNYLIIISYINLKYVNKISTNNNH